MVTLGEVEKFTNAQSNDYNLPVKTGWVMESKANE